MEFRGRQPPSSSERREEGSLNHQRHGAFAVKVKWAGSSPHTEEILKLTGRVLGTGISWACVKQGAGSNESEDAERREDCVLPAKYFLMDSFQESCS